MNRGSRVISMVLTGSGPGAPMASLIRALIIGGAGVAAILVKEFIVGGILVALSIPSGYWFMQKKRNRGWFETQPMK